MDQSKTLKYIDLFILVKTCRLGSPNLSDTEKAVQHQLTGMGITEEMLRQDINLGVRSPHHCHLQDHASHVHDENQ